MDIDLLSRIDAYTEGRTLSVCAQERERGVLLVRKEGAVVATGGDVNDRGLREGLRKRGDESAQARDVRTRGFRSRQHGHAIVRCRHNQPVAYPEATRVHSLLSEICREWRYCLPPGSDEQIRLAIPAGADAVVDLIIRVELGIEPVMAAKDTHRYLRGRVVDRLFNPSGRGVASGLPI